MYLMSDQDTQLQSKEKISYQVPQYNPKIVLSPEYHGTSNYEVGIEELIKEKTQQLQKLREDPQANKTEIQQIEEDLKSLEYLYENFYLGMNVFRTAKGGREKIRE